MLKDTITVQPYSSSYYETTKLVMQQKHPPTTAKLYSKYNTEFKTQNDDKEEDSVKINDEYDDNAKL